MRSIEAVDVVFLARGGPGGGDAAHQVHEARTGIGAEMAAREDVGGGAACEAGGVELARGEDGGLGLVEVRDVGVGSCGHDVVCV